MNNNFSVFLLFSIFIVGIITPHAFAQETPINATEGASNSTSIEVEDHLMVSEHTSGTDDSNSTSVEVQDTLTVTENTGTDDSNSTSVETEDDVSNIILSPLKQIKSGIAPENIVCKEGLELVFKLDGQPACIKTTSIQKLIAWGWTK